MEKITEKEIKELPLEKLEEMLHRQEHLLKKCCVLSKLVDKGASVRKMHELLKTEIENRKLLNSFSQMELTATDDSLDRHSQHVCALESNKAGDRFKPFDTLKNGAAHDRHGKIHHNDVSAAVEPNWSSSTTKAIPLKESLKLQEQHVKKLKEEQAKRLLNELEVVEGSLKEEEVETVDPEQTVVLTSEDLASVL